MLQSSFSVPHVSKELMADIFYDRLEQHIKETQQGLKDNEQLNLYYYDQAGGPILVDKIGYHNPHLIILYGQYAGGNECHILLHMQSVQLVMKIVEIPTESKRKSLGFVGEGKKRDD